MNNVFVFGSINMDFVFSLDRLPKIGETMKANDFFMTPGGKGANQAIACRRQGINTLMLGCVGSDQLSKIAVHSLLESAVDCRYLDITDNYSVGVASIMLTNSDNRIITHSGANSNQNPNRIKEILEKEAHPGDYFLSQLEIPLPDVISAFKCAKTLNLITVLNAAPAVKLPKELLHLIDILVVNETEFRVLSKFDVKSDSLIKSGAQKLLLSGIKSILLTLGINGSIFIDCDNFVKVPAYKVKVVDTTAAGDTYIGSFIASLIYNKNILESMKFASAAASLAIMKKGAQVSIPSYEEVKAFIKQKGEIL